MKPADVKWCAEAKAPLAPKSSRYRKPARATQAALMKERRADACAEAKAPLAPKSSRIVRGSHLEAATVHEEAAT
jgi:hypothetical protein